MNYNESGGKQDWLFDVTITNKILIMKLNCLESGFITKKDNLFENHAVSNDRNENQRI